MSVEGSLSCLDSDKTHNRVCDRASSGATLNRVHSRCTGLRANIVESTNRTRALACGPGGWFELETGDGRAAIAECRKRSGASLKMINDKTRHTQKRISKLSKTKTKKGKQKSAAYNPSPSGFPSSASRDRWQPLELF